MTVRRVARVEAVAEGTWPLNVDGDVWGALPATVEVVPAAVPFLTP